MLATGNKPSREEVAMGTWDNWYVADGTQTVDYIASGTGWAFMAVATPGPRFDIGAALQGFYYGVLSFGGVFGPDGKPGPDENGYTSYCSVLGKGYYVPGVAGTSTTHVGVYGQTEEDPGSSIPQSISAGVFGAANTGSGVVGWSTNWNGVEG